MYATIAIAPATMKAAHVSHPEPDFLIVERKIPKPDAGQVRIKVQECGICRSDVFTKEGPWQYPRVPRHEVVGIIEASEPRR
jgi:D-arabinose 1-dehydrogenase-like Zn-dependent alcohol dehydrogenase